MISAQLSAKKIQIMASLLVHYILIKTKIKMRMRKNTDHNEIVTMVFHNDTFNLKCILAQCTYKTKR